MKDNDAKEWVGADNWLVQALTKAHAERDAALALAERRAGVLKALEWIEDVHLEMDFCPVCGNSHGRGHASNCSLADALAAAPPPATEDAGGE